MPSQLPKPRVERPMPEPAEPRPLQLGTSGSPTERGGHLSTTLGDLRYAADALREEIDAMVMYRERAAQSSDPELARILLHHGREEAEHAAMLIEWIRRNDPVFDGQLETYLRGDDDLVAREQVATGSGAEEGSKAASARAGDPRSGDVELRIEPLAGELR